MAAAAETEGASSPAGAGPPPEGPTPRGHDQSQRFLLSTLGKDQIQAWAEEQLLLSNNARGGHQVDTTKLHTVVEARKFLAALGFALRPDYRAADNEAGWAALGLDPMIGPPPSAHVIRLRQRLAESVVSAVTDDEAFKVAIALHLEAAVRLTQAALPEVFKHAVTPALVTLASSRVT